MLFLWLEMLIGIVNAVSRKITEFYPSVDFSSALRQQEHYFRELRNCGVEVTPLEVNESSADGCFIEDTAFIVDEVAVIAAMGKEERRGEPAAIVPELAKYRSIAKIETPARLEGGDMFRIGRHLFVGLSSRTNDHAVGQLRRILKSFDYEITPVDVTGGLHLTTACTPLDDETLLVNPSWVDCTPLKNFELLKVPDSEAMAANSLRVDGNILLQAGFPKTIEMVKRRFDQTIEVDISEFRKAKGGLTCLSLLFSRSPQG